MPHSGSDWLEVPTIYKAYFLGLCKGISLEKMAKHMVQYLHFRILEISHWTNHEFSTLLWRTKMTIAYKVATKTDYVAVGLKSIEIHRNYRYIKFKVGL